MNRDGALARLGLTGDEDAATVAKVYGQRLAVVHEKLVGAQTETDRAAHQTQLSQLVEAYEFMTNSGRYTRAPVDDGAATMMRSDGSTPMHDTALRVEPGVVLGGRFQLGGLLGQGGMGDVYAARDRLKEEDVAIKVLRPDFLYSAAAKERFLSEAKISCSLSHPNIVRVHDVGVSGDHYYLSMERLHGHTLRQRVQTYRADNRVFTVAEVRDIARQLVDALRYAHRYIVHRDLKPENIWLAEDGALKLMDFGIARAFSASQLTQTGMTLGTAYYMAPEQRVGAKDIDWRADQYALGVVLYELLAGTLPTGAVRPLESLRRDVPQRFAAAVMRAMAAKPEDRFQTLDALLAEIDAPARKSRAAALAAIVVLVVAGAAFAFLKMNSPPPATSAAIEAASSPAAADIPSGTSPPNAQAPAEVETETGAHEPESSAASAAVPEESSRSSAENVSPPAASAARDAIPSSGAMARSEPSRPAGGQPAALDARREQCLAQCDRSDGECRSITRRGRQECMRSVAFGGTGGLSADPANANCAFFGQARCELAMDKDACLARIADRHKACVEVLSGTAMSRRQDCDQQAQESERLCRDELRECRASC